MRSEQVSPGDVARRLVVALDVPSVGEAERLADALSDLPVVLKIGYQLVFTGGLALAERLIRAGRPVFLDLKLHDIPRTIEEGVRSLAGLGATYLTVHAYPQTVAAAIAGRAGSDLRVLGVTVLTSMDDADAGAAGYAEPVERLVASRAAAAARLGIDGLVCAAPDLPAVRRAVGREVELVIPGIRPAGSEAGDQKRVMTPAEAIAAGADCLVVGRPITGAADPATAARTILDEIARAAGGV